MGNTWRKAGIKISRDQMAKNHQDVSAQEEMVQTALRQRDWTHLSFAKWGRGWADAWTTITARPLDSSFVSSSIAIKLVTHHFWREALENETYWGVKDRDSGEARRIQLGGNHTCSQLRPLVSRPWPRAPGWEPLSRHTHRYGPPMAQSAHRICKY